MISKKRVYLNMAFSMIFMVVFFAIQIFYRGKDIDASLVGSGTGAFLWFLLSIIFEKPKSDN